MTRIPVSLLTGKWLRCVDRSPSSRSLCLVLLFALFGGLAWSQSLVIKRVTVIDATDRAAQPDVTVVITGDRIAAVSPWKKAKVPKNAHVVDGAGKFLIPGLWDMHVHGAADTRSPWSHLLFLANGVVGVREMAGPPDAHAWRAQQASTDKPSPMVYLGSPIVDGPNPVWAESIVAANEAQGREVVDQQQQRGADFIKVYDRLPRDAYFAIAEEAHKRGIPFEGHVPESVTAAEASGAGQKCIEHLTRVSAGCSREEQTISRTPDLNRTVPGAERNHRRKIDRRKKHPSSRCAHIETYDEATAQSLFARFIKNGTWQCPTLTMIRGQIEEPLPPNDPRLEYLSKDVRSHWDAGWYKRVPPDARRAMVESAKVNSTSPLSSWAVCIEQG